MRIDCITLFPEMFAAMNCSIMGRAQKGGFLDFRTVNLRDFAINDYGQVDDSPYGGEPGMVLRPEPLAKAIDFCEPKKNNARVIMLAADGVMLTHSLTKELSQCEHLVLVCGHYKGVDERIRQSRVDLSVSVGEFVVSGGELPAMLLSDAIVRLIPGVLGNSESAETDSFAQGEKPGHPVWTRPQEFEGMKVPEILLSGDHKKIKEWLALLVCILFCCMACEEKREQDYVEARVGENTLPYPVYRVDVGDLTGNGVPDIAVGVIKTTMFDPKMAKRLFLFKISDDGEVFPLWLGSRVSQPLEDFVLTKNETPASVLTIERERSGKFLVAVYRYNGFGLEHNGYVKREISKEEAYKLLVYEPMRVEENLAPALVKDVSKFHIDIHYEDYQSYENYKQREKDILAIANDTWHKELDKWVNGVFKNWRLAMLDSLKISYGKLKNDYIQKTDFKQDLSSLSMKDLMLLKSSIYAVNGLYFKDENINAYFMDKKNPILPWYGGYMCLLLESGFEERGRYDKDPITNEKDIKLSNPEKQFVERIEKRIAELRKNNMYISKNGYAIGNTAHIVNMHKIKNFDKNFMDKLEQNNFAIADTGHLQLFHVYEQNNYDKMPSFVTTDLFLQAFHIYLSYALKWLEQEKFALALEHLTLSIYKSSMDLTKSKNTEIAQMAEYNAAFYAIPYTLLTGKKLTVSAKYQSDYENEVSKATAAAPDGEISKFLDNAVMHYTLFKPRGHYASKPEMEAYFKAMMWLQKAYFCRDKTEHLKQSIFMASLLNLDVYASIYEPTAVLIGEPNNLSIMDIARFLKSEKIKDVHVALSAKNVNKVDKMLTALAERTIIKPKLLTTCPDKINFMPQRYMVDNEVLQDLVDTSYNAKRAYPKGLDVFSAFGSEPASDVLNNFYKEEEKWSKYPEEMNRLQKKFRNFGNWNKSVYNKWIESLLVLQKKDKSYPAFMNTKAWSYKNLNTSLASWAELKHDVILYADQPMAAEEGGVCDHYYLPGPNAEVGYVEPNILFWNKLNELIKLTRNTLAKHNLLGELKVKSETLQGFVDFLIEVSKKELAKKPLSPEEYQRIKHIGGAVEDFTLNVVLENETKEDEWWYNEKSWDLVKGPERSIAVVADVYMRNMYDTLSMLAHPNNGILHVATGKANEIYVVVEIGGYLYLTKGATFSYYEFVTPEGIRLTDEEWQKMEENKSKRPAVSEWVRSLIVDTKSKPDIVPKNDYFCFDDCYYF